MKQKKASACVQTKEINFRTQYENKETGSAQETVQLSNPTGNIEMAWLY